MNPAGRNRLVVPTASQPARTGPPEGSRGIRLRDEDGRLLHAVPVVEEPAGRTLMDVFAELEECEQRAILQASLGLTVQEAADAVQIMGEALAETDQHVRAYIAGGETVTQHWNGAMWEDD